ncbi:MAG TPA: hypothetical protein VGJ31_12355, partial [Dongiaceae bacterium]
HGIAFLGFELGDMTATREGASAGLAIATALGARRFIGEGMMIRAQHEFLTGDPGAAETLRQANEIARETPSYILPLGLGLAAMIAPDRKTRLAALSEGEALLAAGAISHNYLFFNRYAIDACLAAEDWEGAERYAAALERSMAEEPLPLTDFFTARGRAVAAAGRGRKDAGELRRLIEEARAVKWQAVIPALEAALAS